MYFFAPKNQQSSVSTSPVVSQPPIIPWSTSPLLSCGLLAPYYPVVQQPLIILWSTSPLLSCGLLAPYYSVVYQPPIILWSTSPLFSKAVTFLITSITFENYINYDDELCSLTKLSLFHIKMFFYKKAYLFNICHHWSFPPPLVRVGQ